MKTIAVGAASCILLALASGLRADETAVAPPPGAVLALDLVADGVQIYVCEAKDQGFDWAFKAPEASLFDRTGRQIGTHFGGPTWKLADGSAVVGEVVAQADAPAAGAIPWLLLRAKSHEGSGALSAAAFIRRADTQGGAAPRGGCDASHLGEPARIRYSARYQIFDTPK